MNRPISRRRLWLMRLAAVLLSILPLIVAELAIRCAEPETVDARDDDPLVDLHQLQPLFVLNEEAGRWEIPPRRLNFFRPDSFLADKPRGSRRIFVLGGSTVQGRPFATETAFSTWLKLRLRSASPETEFEVVNCGGVSYASYRVARILDEVLQHQPDAIVIYTGHNEFLEDREYHEVREMSPLRRRIALLASHIRLVTWIQQQFASSSVPKSVLSGEVDARLDHPGGLDQYHRDPKWKAGVEFHFAETMQNMIRSTQAADVPLVLCVPAGDLVRTPPFKTTMLFEPGTERAEQFETQWHRATDTSRWRDQRLAACEACLELDPQHAGANYIAGRLQYEMGAVRAARPHLVNARDWDVCPLRATSPILDAVKGLAQEFQVTLLDTEALLDQRTFDGERRPDGIPDPELFVDHVHPSVAAHQRIGQALFLEIAELGWFTISEDSEARYQTLAQQHLDSLGEEYYVRGKQRLRGLQQWAAGRVGQLRSDDEP